MNRICESCGSDAVQNRLMLIKASTVHTSGSATMQGKAWNRDGSGSDVGVRASATFSSSSESELASQLRTERIAEIEAVILPLVMDAMKQHDVSMVEFPVEAESFCGERRFGCCFARRKGGGNLGPTPQELLQGFLQAATNFRALLSSAIASPRKVAGSLSGMAQQPSSAKGAVTGATKAMTTAIVKLNAKQALARTIGEELRELAKKKVAEIDARRCVCIRCGARY
jgi:hypothetical protein